MMTGDQVREQLQAQASGANRVTPEQVEAAIIGETYTVLPNGRTTVCQLTLDNGFTVEGLSACVSIENFDRSIGNRIARQNALNQVWQLLGFRLSDQLQAEPVGVVVNNNQPGCNNIIETGPNVTLPVGTPVHLARRTFKAGR